MQNTIVIILGVIAAVGVVVFLLTSGGATEPAAPVATDTTAPSADTAPTPTPAEPAPADTVDTNANSETAAELEMDIVETAVASDDFNTLVAAASAAELVATLQGEGPFTIFAPTDAAFDTLPDGTIDALLLPDAQADLANILTYHVVPGAVSVSDLQDGLEVETVNGATLTFNVSAEGVVVNDTNVVAADIGASNGIIHVIDGVLLPPTE